MTNPGTPAIENRTWNSPRGNNLDIRLQAIECELEANLVVALASAAMGDELALLTGSNFDHTSSNDWPGKGGSEKVDTLINSRQNQCDSNWEGPTYLINAVRLHSGIDEFGDEFLLEVLSK